MDPWAGKILWRRERLPTPVFWPGEFHGLGSPWGHKEIFYILFKPFVLFIALYVCFNLFFLKKCTCTSDLILSPVLSDLLFLNVSSYDLSYTFFFIFFATLCNLRDLSSVTRD